MDNIDLEVLKTCSQWLGAGLRCELVTVLKTCGVPARSRKAGGRVAQAGRRIGMNAAMPFGLSLPSPALGPGRVGL